jgi:hypothetical protein
LAARLPSLSIWPKPPGTVGFQPRGERICLLPGLHPSTPTFVTGRKCHFCVTPLPNVTIGTGILNRFAIAFAFRLRLRSRLTLIRLALIRNPWVFGGGVSHSSYRYSCLQFRFQSLDGSSQSRFCAIGMLPYHCFSGKPKSQSIVSVASLCPQIIDAGSLDQ